MKANERELSRYTPAYEPVSLREPTEAEKKIDTSLKAYMDVEMKLESDEEMSRRDAILVEIRGIFINFVQKVATEVLHMPAAAAEDAGGQLFISGSHRLGVRDIGADIDTVCVAPNFCTREHFFTYLKEDLLKHPDVEELNAVEGAFVPVISFDFRKVNIDLLFARLASNTVPESLDILDDNILIGLDEATEKSLNGPRVTEMIYKLVGKKTFPNFQIVLRCIRKWAKKRGLYGNKLGYLGGINCNIMVAFICQLYPNACPASLLFRFFKHYHDWQWPEPIMLNNIQTSAPGSLLSDERIVWSPQANPRDLMPLITPAYPAMNSSFNVSIHSLEVIRREIQRGFELTETIVKEKAWHKLFEPSDFFLRYSHYLACHIVGTGDNPDSRGWTGFVESRIRRLTQYPFLETLPLQTPIHLYPLVSKTRTSSYSTCYFIGFNLDTERIKKLDDKNIYIDECVRRFTAGLWDEERGYKGERVPGLDFYVDHLPWKRLPKEVFEAFGGYDAAKQLRELGGFSSSASKKAKVEAEAEAADAVAKEAKERKGAEQHVISASDEAEAKEPASESTDKAQQATGTAPAEEGAEGGAGGGEGYRRILSYDLGGRWFPQHSFAGVGVPGAAAGVSSLQEARKRLRETAGSLDADPQRKQRLQEQQLLKQQKQQQKQPPGMGCVPMVPPQVLPLWRCSSNTEQSSAGQSGVQQTRPEQYTLPLVSWNLLSDNK